MSHVQRTGGDEAPQGIIADGRQPRILLRSSWQSVNIGDIGHTPGAVALLQRYFPEAQITLWPVDLGYGARDMLTNAYPTLRIVEGTLDREHQPTTDALARAWREADLFLCGSGSGFPAHPLAAAFHRVTGKPIGMFGMSHDPLSGIGPELDPEGGTLDDLRCRIAALPPTRLNGDLRYVSDHAAFIFCRDTISRGHLQAQGARTPVLEFGPDAQLGMDLRNDAVAEAFMHQHGLETGRFICVIPRLRYTPYYRIRGTPPTSADGVRDAINQRTVGPDHAKLRDMIVRYVRATGNKVLACAEMTYEIELARQELVDPLPSDVKRRVVWRDTYWLPDEAASIYARAQVVISIECHSPLIAYRQGTPAIYVRTPTDTCKGQMYRDLGADDWLCEIDQASDDDLWARLEAIHQNEARARQKVQTLMRQVDQLQRHMVDTVRAAVS